MAGWLAGWLARWLARSSSRRLGQGNAEFTILVPRLRQGYCSAVFVSLALVANRIARITFGKSRLPTLDSLCIIYSAMRKGIRYFMKSPKKEGKSKKEHVITYVFATRYRAGFT